jgi:hypothetical protein
VYHCTFPVVPVLSILVSLCVKLKLVILLVWQDTIIYCKYYYL